MANRSISKQAAGGVFRSLNAKTGTGAGDRANLNGTYTTFSVQCTVTGSTDLKVLLQGSLDGTNYVTLGSTAGYTSTGKTVVKSTNSTPVQYVRLNVSSQSSTAGTITGYIGFA